MEKSKRRKKGNQVTYVAMHGVRHYSIAIVDRTHDDDSGHNVKVPAHVI